MHWILQEYEDTIKLQEILERANLSHSMHKVVPFVGELYPEPEVADGSDVVMFGSYSMRHYARKHNYNPGVWELKPYIYEKVWEPYLLNNLNNSKLMTVRELVNIPIDNSLYFIRPVDDSKELAGTVMDVTEIEYLAKSVLNLKPDECVKGSLVPDTLMMLGTPTNIQSEWRIWVIGNQIVTYSLYKMGRRVIYKNEIDSDALEFAKKMIDLNPKYSKGYVLDICRSNDQLYILETNCINAAGFYASDLTKLVNAIEFLSEHN
jgi:ATP-grasp domain, R2K clade family 3